MTELITGFFFIAMIILAYYMGKREGRKIYGYYEEIKMKEREKDNN